jgi:uncharacterized protein
MEYRKLEKLQVAPSLLGFGCMRFPVNKDNTINEEKAQEMLDMAIQAGVNYIDTAYYYHNKKSEEFVGRALSKYDRARYFLATKLPTWDITETGQVRKYFEEQCCKLRTNHIDFYLLHSLGKDTWENVKKLKILEELEKLRDEGHIRFIGFSFHDEYPVFEEILKYRKWDFCQLQLNYIDTDIQQGIKGYELTEQLDIPVIVMEPVKGGALAKFPVEIENIFKEVDPQKSIASWAFRYAASLPNVKVILSGMTEIYQLEDNLKTLGNYEPLKPEEFKAIEKVTQLYWNRQMNNCTGCYYCMPCPHGVSIPLNFSIWNHGYFYQEPDLGRKQYLQLDNENKANACQECGICEKKCPQSIPIIEDLKRVVASYE